MDALAPTDEAFGLAPKEHATLERHAKAIERLRSATVKTIVGNAVAIGIELQAAKKIYSKPGSKDDGVYYKWLKSRLSMSSRTALRYVDAADFLKASANLAGAFDMSAVNSLTREDVPEDAQRDALKLAKKGEFIDRAKAKEIIEKYVPKDDVDDAPAEPATADSLDDELHNNIKQLRALRDRTPSYRRDIAAAELRKFLMEEEWNVSDE